MKRRTIAISRGEEERAPDDPRVWLTPPLVVVVEKLPPVISVGHRLFTVIPIQS